MLRGSAGADSEAAARKDSQVEPGAQARRCSAMSRTGLQRARASGSDAGRGAAAERGGRGAAPARRPGRAARPAAGERAADPVLGRGRQRGGGGQAGRVQRARARRQHAGHLRGPSGRQVVAPAGVPRRGREVSCAGGSMRCSVSGSCDGIRRVHLATCVLIPARRASGACAGAACVNTRADALPRALPRAAASSGCVQRRSRAGWEAGRPAGARACMSACSSGRVPAAARAASWPSSASRPHQPAAAASRPAMLAARARSACMRCSCPRVTPAAAAGALHSLPSHRQHPPLSRLLSRLSPCNSKSDLVLLSYLLPGKNRCRSPSP